MKRSVIILIFLITLFCPFLMVVGCKKSTVSPQSDTNNTNKPMYIDLLTNAGFIVDNTSLNYGVSAQRI